MEIMDAPPAKQSRHRRPPSRQAHAFLAVLRASERLLWGLSEVLKPSGLSHTQYNVLRILRGAGPDGLNCHQISDRMVNRDPDITRLLDRMEMRGLVARSRDSKDRRVIFARITTQGLELLAGLDEAIDQMHRRQLSKLTAADLESLAYLLDQLQSGAE